MSIGHKKRVRVKLCKRGVSCQRGQWFLEAGKLVAVELWAGVGPTLVRRGR